MISENILFAMKLQVYGIVCLKMLLVLHQLTLLQTDLVNTGLHRNLNITVKQI